MSSTAQATKRRRANGSGSLEVLPSGKARVTFWRYGQKKRQTFSSEDEARGVLAALDAMRADGSYTPEEQTLNDYAAKWLNDREIYGSKIRSEVKSVHDERSRWKTHVAPSPLAKLPIPKIEPAHVNEYVRWLRTREAVHVTAGPLGRPISIGTQRHCLDLVTRVLNAACEKKIIKSNPAQYARIASDDEHGRAAQRFSEDWLRQSEIEQLLSCEAIGQYERAVYACAIGLALRLNDIKSLKLSDVKLDDEFPHVAVILGKTGRYHKVPVLAWLAPILRAHIATLPAKATHLFPTRTGGPHKSKKYDFKWAADRRKGREHPSALELAGIDRKIRFHDLRGTCATHLALGTWGHRWSLLDVQTMLAHADAKVTQRYVRRAIDTLADVAARTTSGPNLPSATQAIEKARENAQEDRRAALTGRPQHPRQPESPGDQRAKRATPDQT